MGRRRSNKPDSLELLLDTICNTFGGVLFIAILVVMLLRQTSSTPDTPPTPVKTPEELQSLAQQLTTLSRELIRLQQLRASQQVIVDRLVPQEVLELLELHKELLAERALQQAAVDEKRAENILLAANVEQTLQDIRQLESDLETAVKQRTELRARLESERKAKTQNVRLPVLKTLSDKREIGVSLRYGRAYLWHDYDAQLNQRGLNARDFVVIGEEDDALVVRPNPARGIPLNESAESKTAIRELLNRFSPRRFYITPIVRPDSYGVFQHFRDELLEMGFEYRLMPVDEDTSITDRGGSGGQVQ
jgi:hypothetical protein